MPETLIIAPHPDDEVLGCFSFLNDKAMVIYVTTEHPLFPNEDNILECTELFVKYNHGVCVLNGYKDKTNKIDSKPIVDLIHQFERYIYAYKPHTVLIPNPSYNQDHRTVYDAALTAMRHHDTNHFVKRILLYEEPETWDTLRKPEPFKANYFVPINIQDKLDAIKVYKSQLRGHRSLDYIEAIAKVRGQQSNNDYAEAFEVVRWCE